MRKIFVLVLSVFTLILFCEDCEKYKSEIDGLMEQFNSIKTKMSDPGISRDDYDLLYDSYNSKWAEVVETKKKLKECIESKKVIVKRKVEVKKVDSELPSIMNIKWGSERNSVKVKLRDHKNIMLNNTDQSLLEYQGGQFMNFPVKKWQFNFIEGKLYACQIILKDNKSFNKIGLYEHFSKFLEKKYGTPSYNKNTIPSSYKDYDMKISSLKNKTSKLYKKWLFRDDDILRIKVNKDAEVLITFVYNKLYSKLK